MDFKHIDTLIKAIYLLKEQIPIIKCLVIGEGPEKKRLEVLVQKLNLKKNIMKAIKNRNRMKQACTNSAKPYDWDIITSKLEEVYRL